MRKNLPRQVFLCSAVFFGCDMTWAVYKCTDQNGKVSFQDVACEKTSTQNSSTRSEPTALKRSEIYVPKTPRPPIGDPEYERQKSLERARLLDQYAKDAGAKIQASSEKLTQACGNGPYEPKVGATSVWIEKCSTWGKPSSVNTTTTARGSTMQWVYENSKYIYINELGLVTTIQH
ncbi:MAG: DUF4124 domain-containing protein [Oxalobacteraceae bacterium]|nr:MAG: DUF4124 domain-containing protein [Oxalobacteraceae bacterium]